MHRRLIHASKPVVEEACKRVVIILTAKEDSFCEGCVMGKATDFLGKEAPVQGNGPFDFVRIDLVTYKNPGHLGYQYSIHIIDMWSNYHWVKFVRAKSDTFEAIRDWIEMIHTQTSERVKIIGIDGGTEFGQASRPFADSAFDAYTRSKGIVVFQTSPYIPWMNGKVERATRDILDKTRAIIIAYKIPKRLWPVVRFNEGPDFKPDNDVDTEYEAVFTDTISEEEEAMIDGRPDQQKHQQQDQEQQEEENAVDWFDAYEDVQDEIVVKMPDTTI
ncbi:hypothetical protein VTI28DRAFT_7502 [Corynascus sepedonium]